MDGTTYARELAQNATSAALTERFPFAIVGHVDHGKSSLIGRLLHDTNSLPEGKFAEIKAASDKRGGQFEWSFLLDALQAERDQGLREGMTGETRERLKALERENRELRQANEILRKASAYFAMAELDRRSRP